MKQLLQSVSNIVDWIETWSDGSGQYNGYVIHPIWRIVNLNNIPNCGQYYGIITGYLNLFKKTNDEKYLARAEKAAKFLAFSLQEKSGKFKNDLYEHNPSNKASGCVIYNALADIGLLELGSFLKRPAYISAAKKNVDWLLKSRFDGEKMSACVNQDMTAVEALLKLYEVKKQKAYLKAAQALADFSSNYVVRSGKFKGGMLRGAVSDKFIVPWYDSKSVLGFLELAEILGEKSYADIAFECIDYLKNNISEAGLFLGWRKTKAGWLAIGNYRLSAPLGYTLYAINKTCSTKKYLKSFLNLQLPTGAFRLTSGHSKYDHAGILGWNQFAFLYLTEIMDEQSSKLPIPTVKYSPANNNVVRETRAKVVVMGREIIKRKETYRYQLEKLHYCVVKYCLHVLNSVLGILFKNSSSLYTIRKFIRKIHVRL